MSAKVSLEEVSGKEDKIAKLLTFQCRKLFFKEDDSVVLPFRFACVLTKKLLNRLDTHVKMELSFNASLREIQIPLVETAYDQLLKYSTTTLGLPPGIGKCLHPETGLLLHNGRRIKACELTLNDKLMGDDGKPRNIGSIVYGTDRLVRVKPEFSEPFVCNYSHILTVFDTRDEKVKDISVNEIDNVNHYRLVTACIEFPSRDTEVDPYRYGFMSNLPIEEEYLFNSVKTRLRVLAGLCDSFYFDNHHESSDVMQIKYDYTTFYLVRSLGFNGYLENGLLKFRGDYSIIPTMFCPKPAPRSALEKFKLVDSGKGEIVGFTLDSNGRFLLDDFKVTHNTVMGSYLAHRLGYRTAIFVHRKILIDQWLNTLKTCFGEVPVLIAGEKPVENPSFIICLPKRKVSESLAETVGTLIIDEAHRFCTPDNIISLFRFRPRYVIAETATLERPDNTEEMIQSIVGVHGVFSISKRPYTFLVVNTGVTVDSSILSDFGAYCRDLSKNEERNRLIVKLVELFSKKSKLIVLSRLKEHVELLCELIKDVQVDTLYGTKNSYSNTRVLIGTMSKIGTGFDEALCCKEFDGVKSDVLIFTHSFKTWQQFEQYRGRVMRSENPIIVWLKDSTYISRSHLFSLKKWVMKTNGKIKSINASLVATMDSIDDKFISSL
ncbi:MAG: hypothetical protein KatS3mg101_0866 [Patescibacteria group bacterium]|nr:MAG: hypothetical protein KatS3mg101_0866 [Patescibacteria group bacterium]